MLRPPEVDIFSLPQGDIRSYGNLPLTPNRDVTPETRRKVLEGQNSLALAEERRIAKQTASIREIEVEFRKERLRLFGKSKYQRLEAFRDTQKQKEAMALLPPAGMRKSDAARRQLHQKLVKESLTFVRQLGINPDTLIAQRERAQKALEKIVSPKSAARQAVGPVPDSRVPQKIRTGHPNPVTIFKPPYPAFGWWINQAEQKGTKKWACLHDEEDEDPCYGGNFKFNGFFWGNDKNTGSLGHVSGMEIWDADDWDRAHSTYRSLFGFWYKMPVAAKLNVWVTAKATGNTLHSCYLQDEWGWSDSWTTQTNSFFLSIPQANEEWLVLASAWYEDGYTEGLWTVDWYPDKKKSYFFKLTSGTTFAKNEWVWLWVGSQTRVEMFVNDVEGNSQGNFLWVLPQIAIGTD